MKKRLFFLLCSSVLHLYSVEQTSYVTTPRVFETLIFQPQEKHVHGSSIVSLPSGDMLAAWFQGSGERTADDVKIMGARLVKGSKNGTLLFAKET